MGLAVKVGGNYYDVTTAVAYRTGGSGPYYASKRFLFYDPITGSLKDGFTTNLPPQDPTDTGLAFTSTSIGSSNYRSVITWTQVPDTDGNTNAIEFRRVTTPTSSTDEFTSTDVTNGPRTITRDIYGKDDSSLTYGLDQVKYQIRVTDSDGEASSWVDTPLKTIPPKLATSPAITSTTEVSDSPVPTFSWTRDTANNNVDSYELTITRPDSVVVTQSVSGSLSSYTPTSNTGYTPTGVVSFTIKSRSTQNSETTDSPVSTTSVSYTLPPAKPTSLTSSGSNSSVTWSWSAPTSGSASSYYYIIRRYTDAVTYTETTGSTATTSLTYSIPNETHHVDIDIYSTFSGKNSLSFASDSYTVPPPTPTLSSPTYSGKTVTTSWSYSSNTNLTDQVLYYKVRSSDAYTAVPLTSTERTYVVDGSYGETFSYYIASESLALSVDSGALSTQLAPKAPASAGYTGLTNSSVTFTWSPPNEGVYDGYAYDIYVYSSPGIIRTITSGTRSVGTTSLSFSIPSGDYLVAFYIRSRQGALTSSARSTSFVISPPTTSSGSVSFTNGTATASWSYSTTTNLTDQRIYYRSDSASSYSYSELTSSTRSFTFAGTSGKTAQFYIVSYSDGGSATGSTYSGVCPVTTNVSSARFTSGAFVANWSNSTTNTGYVVTIKNSSGTTIRTESVGNVSTVTSSSSYYSAGTSYYCQIRATNSYGSGYLGSSSGNKKKLANPYVFVPTQRYTFFTGFNTSTSRWQTADVRQGVLDDALTTYSGDQELVGFFFYGTAFSAVSSASIGYSISTTSARMYFARASSGGSSSDRSPFVGGHSYTSVNTALTSVSASTGSACGKEGGGGWGFSEAGNAILTTTMGNNIISGSWKGIALRTDETSAPSGGVSTNYARWSTSSGAIYLYHDG